MKKLLKTIVFSGLLLISPNFVMAEVSVPTQDVTLKVNNISYPLSAAEIASWHTEKNNLIFSSKYNSEIENTNLCKYAKSIVCKLLLSEKSASHIQKSSTFLLDKSAIAKFIDDLSRQTNQAPVDGKLTMDNGKVSVFALSQKGLELDKEKSVALLYDFVAQKNSATSLELPFTQKDPEISTDSTSNLSITELLGEGRSNFRGSPKNRIFNINVATKRFNGVLIKPGEDFSFVKTLGEVDGEHGYLPELVIKNNITEPEFGGGICQVSTTAFRAAIYSGLEITARRNHAYPVSYYNPQGMDATVYVPKPDLRFVNNTPGYILIQTEIIETELVFRFFGTSDGRKTNVIGPKILSRNSDGSMKTTFTQQVLDANGNTIREDVFNSSYDSPSKYPHPGAVLTQKPKDWSKNEWKKYLEANKKP